jgi:hypothetical protein
MTIYDTCCLIGIGIDLELFDSDEDEESQRGTNQTLHIYNYDDETGDGGNNCCYSVGAVL